MPKKFRSNKTEETQAESVHQEYEQLEASANSTPQLKKVSVKKHLLIAVILILGGAFTHSKLFNSSASPINDRDAKKVVSCAYSSFLNRAPDTSGAKYWQARYIRTNYDAKDLARGLLYSSEGQRESSQTQFKGFINRAYKSCLNRSVTISESNNLITANRNGTSKEDIFALVVKGGDKSVSFPKEEKCKAFVKGGSVTPICKTGSTGTSNDVITTKIGATNIVANKALATNFTNFVNSAKGAGYNLGAYTDPTLASKKSRCSGGANLLKSPGSYRSAADQACLTYLGYPTATGTSMHQWGLAADLTCNGKSLGSSGNCLTWVRNNAAKFGLYNKVAGEVWHYSTTGH